MERLRALLNAEAVKENRGEFVVDTFRMRGNIPTHYKRLSVSDEESDRLARLGAEELFAAYEFKPYYTQSLIAGGILSGDYDTVVVVTPTQYGKLIADDEPVLTSKGWKTHGELKVGDEVIAPNGEFVKVIYVHPKGHADRIVRFTNGETVKCHHNHEWPYKTTTGRKREKCVKNISTAEMERRGVKMKNGERKFVLPQREPVKGRKKDLGVDPYVLGVWLGDGSTTKGQICSCAKDIAVLDKCREIFPDGAEWVHKDTGVITRGFNELSKGLRLYDMGYKSGVEKHIPGEYLTASLEQRLQLLAGLIDTDGYRFDGDGRFYFVTAGERLRDDFVSLLATFGWNSSVVEHEPCVSSSGIVGKKPYWTIGFNPTMDIPCVLERKRVSRKVKQKYGMAVDSIEPIGPVPGNCITVEGGLYCVGRRLMPTHNSLLMGHVAPLMAFKGESLTVAGATAGTTEIIMTYTRQAIRTAMPDIKDAVVGETMKKIDRLDSSMSKGRISFARGGYINSITLGDMYTDISHNKAVGIGTGYIIDEAANVSEAALSEVYRREMARVDGGKNILVMISNPHKPGAFYDALTQPDPDKRTLIVWMDVLTGIQEGRWTAEHILTGDTAKRAENRTKYLLCELPREGEGMFPTPKVGNPEGSCVHVMGLDAAYKGKDNIELCDAEVRGRRIHIRSVTTIKKDHWVDGVTSEDIIAEVRGRYHALGAQMICVDTGQGIWLVQGLSRPGSRIHCRGIHFGAGATKGRVKAKHYAATNASNKRAEMHLDLQGLMEEGLITFDESLIKELSEVLPLITYDRRASGMVQIIPKDKIKAMIRGKSPDKLDAILLAIHAAILLSAL